MEFEISKTNFLIGLRLAQNIADRKSTMPMLANVLLRTIGKDKVLLGATDLNVSLSAEVESVNKAEGGLTVGAKALHDIVANLPGDKVSFKRGDNNWAEIRAGQVKYRLVGMPDRDFPKIPDHREVEFADIDSKSFTSMLDKTLFSVCNDETRFHLNGIYVEVEKETVRMVSTDGHRLSKVEGGLKGAPKLTSGIIVPKKGAVEMRRAIDVAPKNARIGIKSPYLFVEAGPLVLAVKLIDSQFPAYQQVIPSSNEQIVEVDRGLLVEALRRAQLLASDTRGVKLSVAEGRLSLSGDNPDVGEVKEEIEAGYGGPEVSVGFNAKYVIELLSQMKGDKVSLALGGELDPVLIQSQNDAGYLGVVMPMRI